MLKVQIPALLGDRRQWLFYFNRLVSASLNMAFLKASSSACRSSFLCMLAYVDFLHPSITALPAQEAARLLWAWVNICWHHWVPSSGRTAGCIRDYLWIHLRIVLLVMHPLPFNNPPPTTPEQSSLALHIQQTDSYCCLPYFNAVAQGPGFLAGLETRKQLHERVGLRTGKLKRLIRHSLWFSERYQLLSCAVGW